MTRRLRLGQVGGGQGAFIGQVHRIASRIDDRYELVAGAFSSTPQRARASAEALGVSAQRSYDDFRTMAERESTRPDGIDAVSIVTPNHMHYAAAREFLRRGIHVICDKPLTSDLEDARRLAAIARTALEETGTRFFVTYNYSAYPLIRQAREMVANGDLGNIRVVQVEYAQDWLATSVETEGLKQAQWRTDPKRSGGGGAIGDIGTHAFHLAEYVSGLRTQTLAADLHSFGEGRSLDDNAHILLRYSGGARGVLWCSQVAIGHENGLRLRIYGDKGGLRWSQENPNELFFCPFGEPERRITRNGGGFAAGALVSARIPAGHPEGYLEGFGALYNEIADTILGDDPVHPAHLPDIEDGLRGVEFIAAALASSKADGGWTGI
ncbi:MAG: Gfo/Idh/MocA family oxidoreductase [Pseudomonadota bacterium]